MTAKEYLQQIRKNDIRINQLVKEIDDLRNKIVLISGIDYSKDRVQTNTEPSSGALKSIEKLYDAELKLNKMIDKFVDEKRRIVNEIQSLDNPTYIELLYMRYVNYMRLEEIAVDMHYSFDRTRHIHGAALQAFDKIINAEQK